MPLFLDDKRNGEVFSEGNPPILGHVHVPKTAGSSFRQILDEHFGTSHLHLYFDNTTTFIYDNQQLSCLLSSESTRAFSSHFVRRFPTHLAGRRIQYVTFLRHPVEQFISYITYTRKHYLAIGEPILLSHLPPGMPDRTIRDCANWILNEPGTQFRNFKENYLTNFFARYPALDLLSYGYEDPRYRQVRLKMAREVLNGFLVVGISERMDDSWNLLRQMAAKVGIPLPFVQIPRINITATERDSMDWINPDDEVGRSLLRSVDEDMQLYEWALARFRVNLQALSDRPA